METCWDELNQQEEELSEQPEKEFGKTITLIQEELTEYFTHYQLITTGISVISMRYQS
ncbi:hypothetical protein LOAG_02282 [Loa loa]|uniref:Uncharacterized protein n=1 Tax=Loa loa TaxID=7209 RepID=A0A1S0U722_LOALO|nr:hypothetical protein LOAG_02282 [Loa loa]EFO26210.1 hypothetical protein LOAG_02282 [Loa loa]